MRTITTEEIKFLCDDVKLCAEGTVRAGEGEVRLIGITESGERKILRKDSVTVGEFSVEYQFDPISYAVYACVKTFASEISPISDDFDADVSKISLSEFLPERRISLKQNENNIFKRYPVPKKTLFIGNSLVFGMGKYGMCSSAPDKDYFYHVTKYIKSLEPNASFEKLYGSFFEHAENMEAFENWYNTENLKNLAPTCNSFVEDLDLIIIQLGDNINTDLKYATFKLSGDILIKRIKERSPKARIIWVHGWYTRPHVYAEIEALCARHGIESLDIGEARSKENEAHDQPYYLGPDGTLMPTRETWLTHPGDRGMKRIAEMIVDKLHLEN